MSGDDVVAAARDGAAWALTDIWNRYAAAAEGYLRRNGATEPQDMTSEVFLVVFARMRRFRGGEPELRSFIFSVAHHRMVDDRRRTARRGATVAYDADRDSRVAASAEEAALDAIGSEAAARLLMEALPPDQRDVMLLRIVGDLTLEQTATVLGKRVEAVKAAQHRAIARLRKILDQPVSL